jgi:choline dehydrogenase-like flavoprotein
MHKHIVVGAGSAGAIVAARLSENPNTRVLLLEAGPDYADEPATPADVLDSKTLAGPAHDWHYTAIPVDGRTMPYQRGKVVGGTSAINAAAALWALPADFNAWESLGNTLWRWSDVAPWFQRLEADPHGLGPHQATRSACLGDCRVLNIARTANLGGADEVAALRMITAMSLFSHNRPIGLSEVVREHLLVVQVWNEVAHQP